jgi:hypothetical protein
MRFVFHVYVEGVTSTAPDAVRALSDAMAERYGLPAAELYARLGKGRFRVKANVDQATADTYARDLEAIGARVRIEAAQVQPVAAPRAATPSTPAARTSPAAVLRSATPSSGALVALPPPGDRSPALPLPLAQPRPRPALSSLPLAPELRPALSALSVLPAQPEARPGHSSLPPQPTARPTRSSLPPQPTARPTRPSLPPQPASRPTTGPLPAHLASRATRPSLPPEMASRPTTGPLPAHLASRPATSSLPPLQAARPTRPALDVGAADLGRGDGELPSDAAGSLGALDGSGLLSLSSLDGASPEPAAATASAFEAPPMPASIGPAAARPGAPAARAKPEPADLFAPPGGEEAEAIVELAADELAHRARKRLSTPPVIAEAAARAPADLAGAGQPAARDPGARRSRPPSSEPPVRWASPPLAAGPPRPATPAAPRVDPAPATWSAAQLARLAAPRARFAAGVLLAILLGFVPTYIVASIREDHAFRAIDAKVATIQSAVDSEDSYEALDGFRAEQLRQKRSARQRIALTSMVIWAAAGGGLAYAWFKRVPWDRLGS